MNKPGIFDLYADYLITSFSYTTATGLSNLVDNAINHDQMTRFLRNISPQKSFGKRSRKAT